MNVWLRLFEFLRPWIVRLEPEQSHDLTLRALKLYGTIGASPTVAGPRALSQNMPNKVGLAAGFDKDGEALLGLLKLNFGFLELGAVTPKPQSGNDPPRVFRLNEDEAIINRLGFNNLGVSELATKLAASQDQLRIPVGVNIGKNAATNDADAVNDYIECMRSLYSYADFLTMNISSPNTLNLRELQNLERASELMAGTIRYRKTLEDGLGVSKQLLVKIAPDLEDDHVKRLGEKIHASGCDGIIATNTTVSRSGVQSPMRIQTGGLSGRPLHRRAVEVVSLLRSVVPKDFLIVGVGGIASEEDAERMFDAGADLIQLYTGLVYQGLGLLNRLVAGASNSTTET